MAIFIDSRRKREKTLKTNWPQATLVDLTSKATSPFVKFSPFYPHGHIPIPMSEDRFATSVEGIWQGLKVFQNEDADFSKFQIKTMKGIKRSANNKRGPILGHKAGCNGGLIGYKQARFCIYLPSYRWILDHYLKEECAQLKKLSDQGDLVLLDYETNTDCYNLCKPLSHAGLVKAYLEQQWPELNVANAI